MSLQYEMNLAHSGNGLPMSERCQHGRAGYERCPFCHPLPSTAHTRAAADEAMRPLRAVLREEVFGCIVVNGPVTDEQIVDLTQMNPSTVRPRRLELERAGRIKAEGTAKTKSGRKAVTWVQA